MRLLKSYWFWIVLGLAAWWFFTGDTPMAIVRAFVGRGRRLTSTTDTDNDKLTDQSLDDLVAQVGAELGRTVDRDAVVMARVIASENGKGTAKEKAAIGWVLRNDANKNFSGDLFGCATNGHKYQLGAQGGPGWNARYSTIGSGGNPIFLYREIHEDDFAIAEDIMAGNISDPTGGARNFIHWSGFHSFADWLAGHPKVQAWIDAGKIPVNLGGTGVLVVFLPPGAALPEGAARV